ncbi:MULTISPECIES: hypothetical protein [unclassified Enterobacter]|uniref:DUF7946 domain-containing protein n=1 Tax=unclassified Enterobacter TaxID=2608935 RepID=UPI00214812B8|nr:MULTISPECIES: hypothetical protein [unclassified Enterobacter]MCR1322189.1 hypothetical protein [Enterobacter sp. BT1268]MCR1326613.1 hypothetical protein [Enterobacter sp. BT1131]
MEDGVLQDIKISLRYDGKDALNHEIDLNCLGESLKGFSKVLSTAASFSATQKYSKLVTYQDVKVYAREARANCFTLDALSLTLLPRTSCSRGSLQLYWVQYFNTFLRETPTRKMK